MTIQSQSEQHVPFRLEARVIALALELACMNDTVRSAFPLESRAVLFDTRDKWQTIAASSISGSEGSE